MLDLDFILVPASLKNFHWFLIKITKPGLAVDPEKASEVQKMASKYENDLGKKLANLPCVLILDSNTDGQLQDYHYTAFESIKNLLTAAANLRGIAITSEQVKFNWSQFNVLSNRMDTIAVRV